MELKDALLKVFLADLDTRGWCLDRILYSTESMVSAFMPDHLAVNLRRIGYDCTHFGSGLYHIRWTPDAQNYET